MLKYDFSDAIIAELKKQEGHGRVDVVDPYRIQFNGTIDVLRIAEAIMDVKVRHVL